MSTTAKKAEDLNVLVVDDEEKIGELIKIFLEFEFPFHSIVLAPNAMQATQKCLNQDFDLMIVDHVMPGKTGIEFIETVKNTVKFHRVKVILISGYLQHEDVIHAIKLGIKHIVVKPFTRQQLVNQVSDILGIATEV